MGVGVLEGLQTDCARLRAGIPIIGLTATLLGDPKVSDAISDLLGVNRGEFHLVQRSNARHDIQILFRQLHSGIDGRKFPELAWVLRNQDKTLIFGRTISLVFRLKVYLNSLCLDDPHRDFRIRTHTGLNWPDDKEKTLADIANEPGCQIIIATNGLAQGNDIRVIETVIQVGEPESSEMYVQKPGRARPTVQDPRAIFYISATRMKLAAKIVQQTDGCLKCCGCSESSNQQEICPGDVSFGHRDTYGSVQACRAGPSIR
ncbi:hypothetical protein R3P38DRAFT_3242484 [Favolaschia claudopus]|uniref:DNA 3'-5' helicase n=1 Tax=Favolaschia claudopus TaxID=2862362 RepID=A0AAV9Z4Q2_9AGAR